MRVSFVGMQTQEVAIKPNLRVVLKSDACLLYTSKIRIRGFGSVNGTNDPLIVVDGSPYGGSLNDINPQDIESISVLKDVVYISLS